VKLSQIDVRYSYPISAPIDKLGLRADDPLPLGATKSSDGKKVYLLIHHESYALVLLVESPHSIMIASSLTFAIRSLSYMVWLKVAMVVKDLR